MNQWTHIRRLARTRNAELYATAQSDSAEALLSTADELTRFKREPVSADDPLLGGGHAVLDREAMRIWYNGDADSDLAVYYQAHEYAHFWLDHPPSTCLAADFDTGASEEPAPVGVLRVEGYGPRERRECQANVYAREFLLPGDKLRHWFINENLNADAIAKKTGVAVSLVLHQLAHALLVPDPAEQLPQTENATPVLPMDQSQIAAAHASTGPLLIEAGPGTGKTKTLIGRLTYLLSQQNVEPSHILALTFSNRAAEEMRERVTQAAPDEAPGIWIGTFHAFGLELLRQHGSLIGLPPVPTVLDATDAVYLLEQILPSLKLDRYLYLHEPTLRFGDILGAISRAKDELVDPARYRELAEQQRLSASTEEELEAAEKTLEVAQVYEVYQGELNKRQLLDFGDLIFKSVVLLRSHPNVRDQIRATYRQILVDEYQDVNHASRIFLREIAGAGDGLWVVGDIRQSIYRFRGAAPSNMSRFRLDYAGAKVLSLARNYRSQPPVLNMFAALAPQMKATRGAAFTPWEPDRVEVRAQVLFELAEDPEAEINGLATEIKRQAALGIAYRDQAVLGRVHSTLERFAAGLERAGVPVLYLGNLFERDEIRDLLSLIALTIGESNGLVRAARFAEYNIPLHDVQTLLAAAQEQGMFFPRALSLAQGNSSISAQGQKGFARLQDNLAGVSFGVSAWGLLAEYLFSRSQYLRSLLTDASVSAQQRRVALYQFLQFAYAQSSINVEQDRKRWFLDYVRRLEQQGDDTALRTLPAWANGLDAVRLLTVHGSKGLEFRAVYIPDLRKGAFPLKARGRFCPPPVGLITESSDDDHAEEEECLFFVAMSRARDVLCLSRPQRYGGKNSSPSAILELLSNVLPRSLEAKASWINENVPLKDPEAATSLPSELAEFEEATLKRYLECPRHYYYDFVLNLKANRKDPAYLLLHQCVYKTLDWMREERVQGRSVSSAAAQTWLSERWRWHGPVGHPYEGLYQQHAVAMIERAVAVQGQPNSSITPIEQRVPLTYGTVVFTPNQTDLLEDGTEVVQRLRTGRISKSEREDEPVYGLYHRAGKSKDGPRRRVQVRSLSTGEVRDIELTEPMINTRLDKYDGAMARIQAGHFVPQPDRDNCPRCPHYFICPAAEDG